VVDYRDKFLTLSRYAPDDTNTNEKKQERFLNGLHDEMQCVLVSIPFTNLESLVDSAIQMEGKLKQAAENRKRRMMYQGNSRTRRSQGEIHLWVLPLDLSGRLHLPHVPTFPTV
jgi:hypothetical protein